MTRLDQYLKYTGLFKQRSEAKRACLESRIRIGGISAKASREVHIGELLTIDTPTRHIEAEVLEIPRRSVAKGKRAEFYRIIVEREQNEVEELLSFDDF